MSPGSRGVLSHEDADADSEFIGESLVASTNMNVTLVSSSLTTRIYIARKSASRDVIPRTGQRSHIVLP